jgi:hypothetical protein
LLVLGTKLQYKSKLSTQTSRHFTGQNLYQRVFTFSVVSNRVISLQVKNYVPTVRKQESSELERSLQKKSLFWTLGHSLHNYITYYT